MTKHKEDCLSINGKQSTNLEKGIIEFKNCFKQLPVLFKIYADFDYNLRDVERFKRFKFVKVLTQKNITNMFLVVLLIKLFVLTIHLVNQLLFIEVKMLLMNLLKQFSKNISTVKK